MENGNKKSPQSVSGTLQGSSRNPYNCCQRGNCGSDYQTGFQLMRAGTVAVKLPCLYSVVYFLGGFMSNTLKTVIKCVVRGIIIAIVIFVAWKIWG